MLGKGFKKQIKQKRVHVSLQVSKCIRDERAVVYMDILVNLVRWVHSEP